MKKQDLQKLIREEIQKIINEVTGFEEFDNRAREWRDDVLQIVKKNKLGGLKTQNIKAPYSGMVEFLVKVDELQLNWLLQYTEMRDKPVASVEVWSPNKKGFFKKQVSGKNATPEGAWKLVNDIYNGKFKR